MKRRDLNRCIILSVFLWVCSVNGMFKMPGIKKSEIKPDVLVMFQQNRIQECSDREDRAEKLNMELARIMDPPFNSDRSRVNIEKVFDPSINAGVKPKHLMLTQSIFEDESVLTPSPNQKLKLEIFKIADDLSGEGIMRRQLLLANGVDVQYDAVFLMYSPRTTEQFQHLLRSTSASPTYLFGDPQWSMTPEGTMSASSANLIRFLGKILNPTHRDINTLHEFRNLVANYVFSWYLNEDADTFEKYMFFWEKLLDSKCNPKSSKILWIFYRNLQRDKPTVCPELEVMRDDFVDYAMVRDMVFFIRANHIYFEGVITSRCLPDLYKMMGADAEATKKVWNKARECWTDCHAWSWPITEIISRKIGYSTENEYRKSDEELWRMVRNVRNKMISVWLNTVRAQIFSGYWLRLYELKRSGFSGRVAIVNRHYVLSDLWIQSLSGVFGRDNTMVKLIEEL